MVGCTRNSLQIIDKSSLPVHYLFSATSIHDISTSPAHTIRSTILLPLGKVKCLYTKLYSKTKLFGNGSRRTMETKSPGEDCERHTEIL